MFRVQKGQEAIEFILITALVFFGAFFTVLIFGDKLAALFGKESQVNRVASNPPAVVSSSEAPKFQADYETAAEEIVTTKSVGNYELQFNEQGDVMFEASGQEVKLTADVLENLNIVFETSGSTGLEVVLDEINNMIKKHKADYPNSDVPIEIDFGDGARMSTGEVTSGYIGKAEVNSYALKVGNDVIIVQNDQDCLNNCGEKGVYRIEGSIDEQNKFTGTVTSQSPDNLYGDFTAEYNNGNIKNGYFNDNAMGFAYTWNILFNK